MQHIPTESDLTTSPGLFSSLTAIFIQAIWYWLVLLKTKWRWVGQGSVNGIQWNLPHYNLLRTLKTKIAFVLTYCYISTQWHYKHCRVNIYARYSSIDILTKVTHWKTVKQNSFKWMVQIYTLSASFHIKLVNPYVTQYLFSCYTVVFIPSCKCWLMLKSAPKGHQVGQDHANAYTYFVTTIPHTASEVPWLLSGDLQQKQHFMLCWLPTVLVKKSWKYFLKIQGISQKLLTQYPACLCSFKCIFHIKSKYDNTYLPTYQSASCISALAAWLVRILQTVQSWAATSASSASSVSSSYMTITSIFTISSIFDKVRNFWLAVCTQHPCGES